MSVQTLEVLQLAVILHLLCRKQTVLVLFQEAWIPEICLALLYISTWQQPRTKQSEHLSTTSVPYQNVGGQNIETV